MRTNSNKKKTLAYVATAFIFLTVSACSVMRTIGDSLKVDPATQQQPPQVVNCPDVELLGLSSNNMLTAYNYFAQIRNKAAYTKNVTVEWLDMYGQRQRAATNIQAGQMTYLKLCTIEANERKPQDLTIVACY
jgi:hypothetical protein